MKECSHGPNRGTKSSSFIDISDSSEDDLDNVERSKKKQRIDNKMLHRLNDEVASIREIMMDMMSLTADTNLPIGLRRILRDTFKCQICHTVPIRPPVIVTKCCRNLLGCQTCVDNCYSGTKAMTRTYPMCHADWGCNETVVLHGLSDFMDGIQKCIMKMTLPKPPVAAKQKISCGAIYFLISMQTLALLTNHLWLVIINTLHFTLIYI